MSFLGPSSRCIFRQAKSRPSPFLSRAIYPSRSMLAIQQPGKNEKFRPGFHLSPLSNAAILFTADTSSASWKVKKTGIPKGLVGTREPRGVQGMGKLLVALFTGQSKPSGFGQCFHKLTHYVAVDCCGDLYALVTVQVEDRVGCTAEQNQVWKMKHSDLLQPTYLPTRATFKIFI